MRGVQAPELPDEQVQAQQPGPHHAAEVLPVVQAAHRAPRDPLRRLAMARDPPRAKQRRRRQGGPGGTRAPSRTTQAPDIGLDDDAAADDAGLGGRSPVPGVLGEGTPVPGPLEHASADVDEARLAEAGAVPPEVGDEDDLAPGVYEDELHGDADFERAPAEAGGALRPAG